MHLLFINNIWGTYLVDMQLLGNSNKGIRFLQCVIGMLSKYAWVVPLKDEGVLQLLVLFKTF